MNDGNEFRDAVRIQERQLTHWLIAAAFPLWATRGIDLAHGGFHERLSLHADPILGPRRARVQPRQVYAFSLAPAIGWQDAGSDLIAHGLNYFLSKYRRADGLFATLIDADGVFLDPDVLLYDQAFALLGLAGAAGVAGLACDVAGEARRLRSVIQQRFKRPAGGYETAVPACLPLQSNPHMHLLEASLAWMHASDDPAWALLADEIVQLALAHFVHGASLREFFDAAWQPAPGVEGRIVEPGHQFEWACLLLHWDAGRRSEAHRAALHLIDSAERFGVRDGVAINALLDDGSAHDASARLWPQTERLKAAAAAARATGEERYWRMARDAATSLRQYVATPVTGLWYDRRLPSGDFVSEPAPASTLYHIVTACAELRSLVHADSVEQGSGR